MRAFIPALAAILVFTFAAGASAQQPPAPGSGGPLVLEPVNHGFVLAPDIKLTDINRKFSTLVGGYGLWVLDDQLFMGGAGYGLAYQKGNHPGMGYGGFVIGWFFDPHKPVTVSAKGLLGFGATSQPLGNVTYCARPEYVCALPVTNYGYPYGYRYHTTFFVAEPEVDVVAKLGTHTRFTGGIGYRATDDPRGLSLHTGGVAGSFSVQVLLGK
jgi:hypothetical protein